MNISFESTTRVTQKFASTNYPPIPTRLIVNDLSKVFYTALKQGEFDKVKKLLSQEDIKYVLKAWEQKKENPLCFTTNLKIMNLLINNKIDINFPNEASIQRPIIRFLCLRAKIEENNRSKLYKTKKSTEETIKFLFTHGASLPPNNEFCEIISNQVIAGLNLIKPEIKKDLFNEFKKEPQKFFLISQLQNGCDERTQLPKELTTVITHFFCNLSLSIKRTQQITAMIDQFLAEKKRWNEWKLTKDIKDIKDNLNIGGFLV